MSNQELHLENPLRIPPFPFPEHLPRPGEPPFPSRFWTVPNQSIGQLSQEERSQLGNWLNWVDTQPDEELLTLDYGRRKNWQMLGALYDNKFVKGLALSRLQVADKLRRQGYAEIIDTYWPQVGDIQPNDYT